MQKKQSIIDDPALEYIKSLTLLCVEDNLTTQLLYSAIFEDKVKTIIFANNGQEGYEKFLDENIDIVISDYDMPVLNGLDMIEKIRGLDNDIPIVLVSAIEEVDVILKALHLNVNNFIKKPIIQEEVITALTNVTKLSIANKYLEEQRNKKIKELEAKEEYSSYQQDLAFKKELNILRNDFYYKMSSDSSDSILESKLLVDFFYQPLDVLSGDAYTVRAIGDHSNFFLIVDGMGKGLSASLSSMLLTSFINHMIDKMLLKNSFDLHKLIEQSLMYIQPILLDEEAVAVDFILMSCKNRDIHYAKFAMPATLIQDNKSNIHKLKSNNPPLSKYQQNFKISSFNTDEIVKVLIYSDGVVENTTEDGKLYQDYIADDFLKSFTKEDFKQKLLSRINTQEDDITLIFLNKLHFTDTLYSKKSFKTLLSDVDSANEWYSNQWNKFTDDATISYKANIVFTELFMNAYEHGNLGLLTNEKSNLIANDLYFDTLVELEKKCNKSITVQIDKITYYSSTYIITQIIDEGNGFDTEILTKIFRNREAFNGRGVYISRQSSLGIYYNAIGNRVLYLHKI